MKKRAIIGISSSLIIDHDGLFPGYERAYVNKDYIDAIIACDATPLVIPLTLDKEAIKHQVSLLDGLILSGGQDVNPHRYGQEPLPKLGIISDKRDEYEFILLEEAKAKNIAIMGICRGLQLINVFEGGTLYQDLDYMENSRLLKHSQGHDPSMLTHYVEIRKNTILRNVFKQPKIMVNTFHHQAIDKLADGFVISAASSDGLIEAIESTKMDCYFGVQWHPEMIFKSYENTRQLFEYFVNKALK